MTEPSPYPNEETEEPMPNPEPATDAEESNSESAQPESAQSEIEKWKDLAYRSQAELDNFRKRTAREAQEARAYANSELLRSILPVLDSFEMGLEAARSESAESMIFKGMQMVHRQFQDLLKDFGAIEIDALSKSFDPNVHEAVSQEPGNGEPEGTILRVTRRGYRLKERLLRPASVIVSSGAPAATPEDQA